jgi:hypothetical protein
MSGLAGFLLARIAEDEDAVRQITAAADADYAARWSLPASATVDVGDDSFYTGDRRLAQHIARHDPARVLADCDAKRRIVKLHAVTTSGDCVACDQQYDVLRLLASPYADHPDYRSEWAP